jgi:ribosomal protein S12 methylthiotransferase
MKSRRDLPVFPITAEPVRPDVPSDVAAVQVEMDPVGPFHGPRIGLVTLGCDKNTVDSERMMAALVGHGAQVSSEVEGADVVIVNTCGFIEAAKEQSVETILEACELKASGDLRAVVAVGCLVQRYKEELEQEIPEVDLFMGLTELQGLIPELRARGILPEDLESLPTMERPLRIMSSETPHTSYLKISEGCDHTCAFCAIPLMRGLHRSMPVEDLVREARGLESQGVWELNVISQDTTWYGRDLRRRDPELVEFMAREPRIVPYLDMPLQHGSDRMLAAMRRPERRRTILERVGWLRDALPDLTLRTTVIVGFPGETDEDFEDLLALMEEVRFDRLGAFTYSIEEGTRAAEMDGQLPESLKRERLERLMDVQRSISFDRNMDLVGRRLPLLVDRKVEDDLEFDAAGRTPGQALDVDGVTQLVDAPDVNPGEMVEVEIVDALDYDLIGRVVRT